MHLKVCEGEEKGRNTHMHSLASPHRAGRGRAGHDEAMGAGAQRACE
jgi:hypothetical protein